MQQVQAWLDANQAQINEAGEVSMPDYEQQLAAVAQGEAYSLLGKYALLHIHGEDATSFLQGQFSCDVAAIASAGVTLGSYSTAKGRMQASFVLAGVDGAFYLLLRRDIADTFRRRLSMFVLRAKVKIEDVSTVFSLWLEQDASAQTPALRQANTQGVQLALGQGLVVHLQADGVPAAVAGKRAVGSAAADLLFIRAGLGWVSAATFEEFVPQMLNLEVLGGINFKKGCYPGQEIVARTQYLGKIKRRLYRAQVQGALVPEGAAIIAASTAEQVIGRVVLTAAVTADSCECLLVIQSSAWLDSPALQEYPVATLKKLPLPYSLPDAD